MKEFELHEAFRVSVKDFFDACIEPANFKLRYHELLGDSTVDVTPWTPVSDGCMQRVTRYLSPISNNSVLQRLAGGSSVQVKEIQRYWWADGSIELLSKTLMEGTALSNSFHLETKWSINPAEEGCELYLRVELEYKGMLLQSAIESYCYESTQTAYTALVKLIQEELCHVQKKMEQRIQQRHYMIHPVYEPIRTRPREGESEISDAVLRQRKRGHRDVHSQVLSSRVSNPRNSGNGGRKKDRKTSPGYLAPSSHRSTPGMASESDNAFNQHCESDANMSLVSENELASEVDKEFVSRRGGRGKRTTYKAPFTKSRDGGHLVYRTDLDTDEDEEHATVPTEDTPSVGLTSENDTLSPLSDHYSEADDTTAALSHSTPMAQVPTASNPPPRVILSANAPVVRSAKATADDSSGEDEFDDDFAFVDAEDHLVDTPTGTVSARHSPSAARRQPPQASHSPVAQHHTNHGKPASRVGENGHDTRFQHLNSARASAPPSSEVFSRQQLSPPSSPSMYNRLPSSASARPLSSPFPPTPSDSSSSELMQLLMQLNNEVHSLRDMVADTQKRMHGIEKHVDLSSSYTVADSACDVVKHVIDSAPRFDARTSSGKGWDSHHEREEHANSGAVFQPSVTSAAASVHVRQLEQPLPPAFPRPPSQVTESVDQSVIVPVLVERINYMSGLLADQHNRWQERELWWMKRMQATEIKPSASVVLRCLSTIGRTTAWATVVVFMCCSFFKSQSTVRRLLSAFGSRFFNWTYSFISGPPPPPPSLPGRA